MKNIFILGIGILLSFNTIASCDLGMKIGVPFMKKDSNRIKEALRALDARVVDANTTNRGVSVQVYTYMGTAQTVDFDGVAHEYGWSSRVAMVSAYGIDGLVERKEITLDRVTGSPGIIISPYPSKKETTPVADVVIRLLGSVCK